MSCAELFRFFFPPIADVPTTIPVIQGPGGANVGIATQGAAGTLPTYIVSFDLIYVSFCYIPEHFYLPSTCIAHADRMTYMTENSLYLHAVEYGKMTYLT